jgi:hypothetical protein
VVEVFRSIEIEAQLVAVMDAHVAAGTLRHARVALKAGLAE